MNISFNQEVQKLERKWNQKKIVKTVSASPFAQLITSGELMPDWSRGGRDKLRAPLLAALFLLRLIGVWERDLFSATSPWKQPTNQSNYCIYRLFYQLRDATKNNNKQTKYLKVNWHFLEWKTSTMHSTCSHWYCRAKHTYKGKNKTKTRNQAININNNNNNNSNNSVAHLFNAFHLYISTNLFCDVFSAASGLSLNVEETKQISDSRTHVSIW